MGRGSFVGPGAHTHRRCLGNVSLVGFQGETGGDRTPALPTLLPGRSHSESLLGSFRNLKRAPRRATGEPRSGRAGWRISPQATGHKLRGPAPPSDATLGTRSRGSSTSGRAQGVLPWSARTLRRGEPEPSG